MNKRYKTIRRVIITYKFEEAKEALQWAYDNGYHILRSGPKQLSLMKYSATTGQIVAEKKIKPSQVASNGDSL